jgi:hypothetical protein
MLPARPAAAHPDCRRLARLSVPLWAQNFAQARTKGPVRMKQRASVQRLGQWRLRCASRPPPRRHTARLPAGSSSRRRPCRRCRRRARICAPLGPPPKADPCPPAHMTDGTGTNRDRICGPRRRPPRALPIGAGEFDIQHHRRSERAGPGPPRPAARGCAGRRGAQRPRRAAAAAHGPSCLSPSAAWSSRAASTPPWVAPANGPGAWPLTVLPDSSSSPRSSFRALAREWKHSVGKQRAQVRSPVMAAAAAAAAAAATAVARARPPRFSPPDPRRPTAFQGRARADGRLEALATAPSLACRRPRGAARPRPLPQPSPPSHDCAWPPLLLAPNQATTRSWAWCCSGRC